MTIFPAAYEFYTYRFGFIFLVCLQEPDLADKGKVRLFSSDVFYLQAVLAYIDET